MVGKVISFNKNKGYGFITTDEGQDVFFHYSQIIMEGFKDIDLEQKVEFEIEESPRGPRAINIKKI